MISKNIVCNKITALNELVSDHLSVLINIKTRPYQAKHYSKKIISWNDYREYINTNLKINNDITTKRSISHEIKKLTTLILDAEKNNSTTRRDKNTYLPEIVLEKIKQRNRLRSNIQRNPSQVIHQNFKSLNREIKQNIKQLKTER